MSASAHMAAMHVSDVLREQMENPATQWSLGTFGGIAEFSRDPDEPIDLDISNRRLSVVSARGGFAILPREDLRLVASESLSPQSWNHRVALCLPQSACAMNRRTVLTELAPDADALRAQDRDGVLFDLGLDALQVDLCVRIRDHEAIARLRPHLGRYLFEPGNPAMSIIFAANPHRVFISRVGRMEVYQPIPPADGKSPDGPHTHVLPKLLKSRRTHPATEAIPDGWVPCAHLYPAHPAKDAFGQPRAFDGAHHAAFQNLLAAFGQEDVIAAKRQVIAAVESGQPPAAPDAAEDRLVRAHIRVTLRQLRAAAHPARALDDWCAAYDARDPLAPIGEEDDDPRSPPAH